MPPKHLGYLGTATIQQADVITELSCAFYSSDEKPPSWSGRYWDPAPGVELHAGRARLRLHDATDADVEIVRAGPHSGTFRVVGALRDLRERPAYPAAVFPWESDWHGRLEQRTLESNALRGNPLGDPHVRPVYVYVPPGYDDEPERRYPSVYVIQGLTGQVDMWLARERWGARNYPELADELFASGAPPCLVVFVDAWTRYGGSQYVDSAAVGRYHTYLCDEVVPWVDAEYRTLAAPEHRGIQGKSSGGYGAQITPMLRPDLFGALASHAGDSLFEYCFLPEFPAAARALAREYDGSPARFWDDFWSRRPHDKPTDMPLVGVLSMAACYSPNEDGSYELPFELPSGRVREDVWARWLEWDPVRMVPRYAEALQGLRGIYLDAGTRDEFSLDVGAGAMHEALGAVGVKAWFELFEGGHFGIDHRYPIGLRFLAEKLAP